MSGDMTQEFGQLYRAHRAWKKLRDDCAAKLERAEKRFRAVLGRHEALNLKVEALRRPQDSASALPSFRFTAYYQDGTLSVKVCSRDHVDHYQMMAHFRENENFSVYFLNAARRFLIHNNILGHDQRLILLNGELYYMNKPGGKYEPLC